METGFAATLLAIAETGSVAAAGRRMGITPGAVALRVRALEAELGVLLTERVGRKVVPTAAALRLLGPFADIVARTADLRRVAAGHDAVAGELRIGTIATASTGILPALLDTMTRLHPQLDLFIVPGTSSELCEQVLNGMIDAAIVVEPSSPLRKGEEFTVWIEEPLVLVVPAGMEAQSPLIVIEREPFIRYDRRSRGGRIVDRWLKANDLRVRDRIELDALDGIVAMVSAGLGVAIIPDWAGPRPAGTHVGAIALPPPVPVRRIGLYHRRTSSRQELVTRLARAFQAEAPVR